MDQRKSLLIEIKRKAGLATPDECAEYDNAWVIIGEGLAIRRPARDDATFQARYGHLEHELFVSEEDMSLENPERDDSSTTPTAGQVQFTRIGEGLIQCAPGQEPPVPGCPNYDPTDPTAATAPAGLRDRYIAEVRGRSFRRS